MLYPNDINVAWVKMIHQLQDEICAALEQADGLSFFTEDVWVRPEGGGGKTRIIQNGKILEKGGVNTSVVYGKVTPAMQQQLNIQGAEWFACGISLVIHPINPYVPTIHCNYRMFELYNATGELIDRWFGGGTDLTPYYLFDEDAVHFHQTYKNVCDDFHPAYYQQFKKACDNYFVNHHRNNERRGIGGIFYDYQRPNQEQTAEQWMTFAQSCANALIETYIPIIQKRAALPFSEKEKYWQEIRRGRYVEFNLIHDRGTLFGLKTNGRVESILMSLPPRARFDYQFTPEKNSREEKLLEILLNPKDWINQKI